MSANPERRARKGCYVVIGYDQYDYTDYLVGQYISISRAKKAARNRARVANGIPTSFSDVFFVYDDAGECRYRMSFDELPAHLRQPAAKLDIPEALPLRDRRRLASLSWRDWPIWLSLPIILGVAAVDFWYMPKEGPWHGYYANFILERLLGVSHYSWLSLVSLVLFYFLPLYLWLTYARNGVSLLALRRNTHLFRWILGGLILSALGLVAGILIAYALGMEKEPNPWELVALMVACVQVPYYLWLRRQPDSAL